jgi:tetratricopeptide (TPR) repeat protein
MGSWPSQSRAAERAASRQRLFDAVDDLRSALELDPGLDEARLRLGRLQWQLGRGREARATLEALLARATGSGERYLGHLFLGRVLEDAGDGAAALAHYRQALALDPAAQAGALAVAHALQVDGDLEASREVVRHALKQAPREDPRDGWLSYNIGRSGQYESLLQNLRAELSP